MCTAFLCGTVAGFWQHEWYRKADEDAPDLRSLLQKRNIHNLTKGIPKTQKCTRVFALSAKKYQLPTWYQAALGHWQGGPKVSIISLRKDAANILLRQTRTSLTHVRYQGGNIFLSAR